MEKVELTVNELYQLRNDLLGFSIGEQFSKLGFLNEKGITESVKRRAYKALKIILSELEPINKQLDEIREKKDEKREEELLSDIVTILVEKIDFKFIENATLSSNYQLLYDKIFINA